MATGEGHRHSADTSSRVCGLWGDSASAQSEDTILNFSLRSKQTSCFLQSPGFPAKLSRRILDLELLPLSSWHWGYQAEKAQAREKVHTIPICQAFYWSKGLILHHPLPPSAYACQMLSCACKVILNVIITRPQ